MRFLYIYLYSKGLIIEKIADSENKVGEKFKIKISRKYARVTILFYSIRLFGSNLIDNWHNISGIFSLSRFCDILQKEQKKDTYEKLF